jgi:sterol desaturase/sphingolipid hydroxylase (fatty acid hydroxylase superfamily)
MGLYDAWREEQRRAPQQSESAFQSAITAAEKRWYGTKRATVEFNLSFSQLGQYFSGHANAYTMLLLPAIILAIVAEVLVMQSQGRTYPWKSSLVSASISIGHLITQAMTNGLIIGIIAAAVYHWRLFNISVSWQNWWLIVALFLVADLAFYVEHRCSHRIRFMWASHSVHHSVDRMVFTAAFRLAWTPVLSGVFLFYLPVVWLGFPPEWVLGVSSASITYQIFVHTETIPRIGWLEWIINTPSAHRVHHASNAEYLDRNFGNVLLIWDRLFGTYQSERSDVRIAYGLTHPRKNNNPFVIAYEEFWDMFRDVLRSKRPEFLLRPPDWTPP